MTIKKIVRHKIADIKAGRLGLKGLGDLELTRSFSPRRDEETRHMMDAHALYVSNISSPIAAVSRELSLFLSHALDVLQPESVLDLGSGFSSLIFRTYLKNQPSRNIRIVSCDDNEHWLAKTADFLESRGLSTEDLLLYGDFEERCGHMRFDLILHDLGNPETRIRTLPAVMKATHNGSMVVFDDVHKITIRETLANRLKERSFTFYDLKEITLDEYGRYSWLAVKER